MSARRSGPPPTTKSESAGPGHTSASLQLGLGPEKPLERSTRRLKPAIHLRVPGSVRSGAWTLTSSSPETPVASWSLFRSRTAPMLCGASSRTSETLSIWVPNPHPRTARASPAASSSRGRLTASASRRSRTRGRWRGSGAPPPPLGERRLSAAKPAVRASPKAIAMPTTRSRPKLLTMGVGESRRARKPAPVARQAVPIVGPPRGGGGAYRVHAARAGGHLLVEAGLKLDRVVDGEADQDRQRGDRGHRQRAPDQAEEPEGERRGGERHGERQEPQAGAEDDREDERHHADGDCEQEQQGVLQRSGQAVDDDRGPRRPRSCRP